ncbi:MAG: hypothetical protein L0Y56_03910 [Nitrospira sp.]|nr:hypothetical protein [Nitrospira sp.]
MKIKATAYEGNKVAAVETCEVNIPGTIEGMIKTFGAEVCTDRLRKIFVIDYQAVMRGKMYDKKNKKVGLKGKALQDAVNSYKPALKKKGTASFLDRVRKQKERMSQDEIAVLVAELTGQSAPKAATPAVHRTGAARRTA